MNEPTAPSGSGERIRVAFVAPACVLDTGSGAAASARTILEMLAQEGFACASFTPSVFDGFKDFPLHRLIGAGPAEPQHAGKTVRIDDRGVTHMIFRTSHTVDTRVTDAERRVFIRETFARVKAFAPHVILSYASGAYGAALFAMLRRISARLVLYCLNAGIDREELFRLSDAVVCPSNAMVELCRQRFGVAARLLRDPIAPRNAADPSETLAVTAPGSRAAGFVSFISPSPPKGGALVLALARKALRVRPELTFLIVEGRFGKSFWEERGVLASDLPNIWWLPAQPDLRSVYARTSALLYPSFGFEAAGRSIVEAQLGGIPVLASRRGGIPEQLNGGGFLFELPSQLDGSTLALPDDSIVDPWLHTLARLIDDEAFYRAASERALAAALPFRSEQHRLAVAALFRELAPS